MEKEADTGADRTILACGPDDRERMFTIINAAAVAYRDVIPADCWHEPYMPMAELDAEIAAGVAFSACLIDGRIVGIMGVQRRANVDLIRHAYVDPKWQGRGIGSSLLRHLVSGADRPILIGTWQAADWAIRFYQRHHFTLAEPRDAALLLRTYWTVPDHQIETSVVLASHAMSGGAADALVASGGAP